MSSTTGKWREEQVLIVCPGSRMTMAQLGCSELTLPTRRMQTRMFKDGEQWAPHHRTKRTKLVNGQEEEEWVEDVDEDEGAVYPIQGMICWSPEQLRLKAIRVGMQAEPKANCAF